MTGTEEGSHIFEAAKGRFFDLFAAPGGLPLRGHNLIPGGIASAGRIAVSILISRLQGDVLGTIRLS
jgi:hypothetical protein